MSGAAGLGRAYKSRKQRPCDGCRKRKVACEMLAGPPCERCTKLSKSCEFLEWPAKRQRHRYTEPETLQRLESGSPGLSPLLSSVARDLENGQHRHLSLPWYNLWSTQDQNSLDVPFAYADDFPTPGFWHAVRSPPPTSQSLPDQQPSPSVAIQPRPAEHADDVEQTYCQPISLENLPQSFSFYIGPTGTSDASLLRRQAYDGLGHTDAVATGLKFRRVADNSKSSQKAPVSSSVPMFGITEDRLIKNAEPRVGAAELEEARSDLWSHVERETALRLCRLYFKFVNPYFPVLTEDQCPANVSSLETTSLALLVGMCATALPFMLYDEALYDVLPQPPSSNRLYRLCWSAICYELHAPTLATVQACLLLQHGLPTNPVLSDTAFKWSLIGATTSAAQTIGLHRNSLSWNLIPSKERTLRHRLWWALWTMEKWIALSRGMPSHLNDCDSDVVPLEVLDSSGEGLPDYTRNHFEFLVQLTTILADIQCTYYTVRGEATTATDLRLSLEEARPLRARLRNWQESLPTNLRSWAISYPPQRGSRPETVEELQCLDGNGALHLSYIVTHMMLFRALLRPLEEGFVKGVPGDEYNQGAAAVVRGALICVKELVEFLEKLRDPQWNAFWHCWSRPNFAMAGSFMVQLLCTISPRHGRNAPTPHNPSQPDDSSNLATQDTDQTADSAGNFSIELGELLDLIRRWRWINRVSAQGAAGVKGLTNLGLFKVETLLARLGQITPE